MCWYAAGFVPCCQILYFPRFGLSRNTEFEPLKRKLSLKMLRQYQLHGGIRRLQTRFDQSKRFGTTTTMAATAAPTPWNRSPSSIDDFRWWDEIVFMLSCPLTSKDATIVHRTKYSGEPFHGKLHTLLVPAHEHSISRLDEPCFKKSPGSETLNTVSFSCPQTTHFHQVRRIQRTRPSPKNSSSNPIPPSEGGYRLPNRGVDLQG